MLEISVSKARKLNTDGRQHKDVDTKTLLLCPIEPKPFSVEPRTRPLGFSNTKRRPKEIMGAEMIAGKMKFLMKWGELDHDCTRCTNREEFVSARSARIICPKVVIKFYESRIEWGGSQEIAEGDSKRIATLIQNYQLKKLTVKL